MPFALLTALGIVAVLFILIQIVAIGTLPELAKSDKPLADSAGVFMGAFGAAFITVGAIISILGNLNGGYLATTRIPFAMAEQKELPEFIGRTHENFKTPYVSILITAMVILVWTLLTSFLQAVAIATITRLMVYATTCAVLPVFRRREDVSKAEFTAPFGVGIAILSLILIVWLLTQVDYLKEGLPILAAIVIGLVLYFINSFFRKNND